MVMDYLAIPKLGRFRKFTQKLIPYAAKEKTPCSMCGGKFSDQHFCRPLFKKNFVQFTRSIKLLERNEYFYGSGRKQPKRQFRAKSIKTNESVDRKLIGNKKNGLYVTAKEAPGDEINYLVTSHQATADGVKKTSSGHPSAKKYEPRDSANEVNHGQIGGSRLSSYYAYVSPRGYEKRPGSLSKWIVKKRLHELFEPVSIESLQNLKIGQPGALTLISENCGDSRDEEATDSEPEDPTLECQPQDSILKYQPEDPILHYQPEDPVLQSQSEDPIPQSHPEDLIPQSHPEDPILQRQPQDPILPCHPDDAILLSESEDTTLQCQSEDSILQCQSEDQILQCQSEESSDDLRNKEDDQNKPGSNVSLELLKIAVNTQVILNSLFQHFKQAFSTERQPKEPMLKNFNDSNISVDSFMIPNMPGPVLWGHGEGVNERNVGMPLYVDRLDAAGSEDASSASRESHQLSTDVERPNFCNNFTSILYRDSKFSITQDSNTDEEVGSVATKRFFLENSGNSCHKSSKHSRNPMDCQGRHRGIQNQSILDCVFNAGLGGTPSLQSLPVPDLIDLSTPSHSANTLTPNQTRKDAVSQTTLSSQHLDRELCLLHKAFLDQLAYFSKQLADSCRNFGHSWQTKFLADLAEQFKAACDLVTVIMDPSTRTEPASELNQLESISSNISICLAKLRTLPQSIGNSTDYDMLPLMTSVTDSQTTNTCVEKCHSY